MKKKSIANIILNDEKLEAIPLKLGTDKAVTVPLLFYEVLEALAKAVK